MAFIAKEVFVLYLEYVGRAILFVAQQSCLGKKIPKNHFPETVYYLHIIGIIFSLSN